MLKLSFICNAITILIILFFNTFYMLASETDEIKIFNIISHIKSIICQNWNAKFTNILFREDIIELFDKMMKNRKPEIIDPILQILGNISFFSDNLDSKVMGCLISIGLLNSIFEWMIIPQNSNDFNTEICKNALLCLLNLSIVDLRVNEFLYENNIIYILADLCEHIELINNPDLQWNA